MRTLFTAIACSACLVSATYAASNPYLHTDDSSMNASKMSQNVITSETAKTMGSTDCMITIKNNGIYDVRVYGRFDDGTYLTTFTIPWLKDDIAYVSLYYYGYCHGGMDFYIDTVNGKYKYNGYTPVGKTITIN